MEDEMDEMEGREEREEGGGRRRLQGRKRQSGQSGQSSLVLLGVVLLVVVSIASPAYQMRGRASPFACELRWTCTEVLYDRRTRALAKVRDSPRVAYGRTQILDSTGLDVNDLDSTPTTSTRHQRPRLDVNDFTSTRPLQLDSTTT